VIELQHISKRFGPLKALDDVSLQIEPGQVLGLLGENGAGKSTLMNILFGLIRADGGQIVVRGKSARIQSPRDAQRFSIGMVHQHFKLVPTLTALENLRLFLPGNADAMRERAVAWLKKLGWSAPLDIRVDDLSVGQQQRIEILKALMTIHGGADDKADTNHATLILDEPTAVLTPQETVELFAALGALRDAGTTIVFISHKLVEIRKICDHVAILRRGKLVHTGPTQELSPDQIAEKMVGTRVEMPHLKSDAKKPRDAHAEKAALLTMSGIRTDQLKNVSLQLQAGEILGIAGVDGNGQSHLVQTLLAARAPQSGQIMIDGHDAANMSTRDRLEKIAFIPEDRQIEALVMPLTIQDNLMLKDYRSTRFSTLGWLRFSAWKSHTRELIEQFDIRAGSPTTTAGRLSGGNQQKVVLARELYSADKPIILAVNPTRGLDVGATAFVLQKLLDARARGAGVLLIHSDLDELLAISDRVAVIYSGTLTQTQWPATTKDAIGKLMLGV
jgi:simple sugar transport system ATP-binding protein